MTKIIVLDGYDGSGKTTLARLLAERLNGRYLKSFTDSLGNLIWWMFAEDRLEMVDLISRAACEQMYESNKDAKVLIFDRHWMTMFTVLTENYYKNWLPLPNTFLCTATVETIEARLHARNEKMERSLAEHQGFLEQFSEVAREYGVTEVDTTSKSPEEALAVILSELEVPAGER